MVNINDQVLLDTVREMDGELREAARMDLLLPEKNARFKAQVEPLASDLNCTQVQLREGAMKLETLRKQRNSAILEVNLALIPINVVHWLLLTVVPRAVSESFREQERHHREDPSMGNHES
ncbi:hypothetical protein AC1031_002673 [Aphanomyces cochlioides]|nr:hypothetical protein AC1031_002673 [Aphanomyces cochlioides]